MNAVPTFERANGHDLPLTERYRPETPDELLGQPAVADAIRSFLAAPTSGVFLFHGPSGTGKTSAGHVLARKLGCAVEEGPFGGFFEIPSGNQGVDEVKEHLARLNTRPWYGSGWRVLIVNECDRMSKQAETVWLDGLEHLPPQSVVVFTTNDADALSERFLSRCEPHKFTADVASQRPSVAALAAAVWKQEGLTGSPPAEVGIMAGRVNFRLALQQLAPAVRIAKQRQAAVSDAKQAANAAYLEIRSFIRDNGLALDVGAVARGEVKEAFRKAKITGEGADVLRAALEGMAERFRKADAACR